MGKENLFLKLIHVNYYSLKEATPSLDGDASFIYRNYTLNIELNN